MTTKVLRNICCVIALTTPLILSASQPTQSPRGRANAADLRKVPIATPQRMVRLDEPLTPRGQQNLVRVDRRYITKDRLHRGVAVTSPRTAQSFPVIAANARALRSQDDMIAKD